MSDGPKPACGNRQKSEAWQQAEDRHLDKLGDCDFCFVDVDREDIDRDDLLVVEGGKELRSVHRHEDTGPLNYSPPRHEGTKPSTILGREDVTTVEEARQAFADQDEATGGSA